MILLDTHAWIWWTSDRERLSPAAREVIRRADRALVSAISCWEFSMLVAKGRITIKQDPLDWMERALVGKIEIAPLTPQIAARSTRLRGFHGDPCDRIIVATALVESVPLISKDTDIRNYAAVTSVW